MHGDSQACGWRWKQEGALTACPQAGLHLLGVILGALSPAGGRCGGVHSHSSIASSTVAQTHEGSGQPPTLYPSGSCPSLFGAGSVFHVPLSGPELGAEALAGTPSAVLKPSGKGVGTRCKYLVI